MQSFINLNSISKTLRFELKITKELDKLGMSKDFLKNIILSTDEDRYKNYGELKKIIKNYHSDLIEKILEKVKNTLSDESVNKLNKYIQDYQDLNKSSENKDKSDKKDKNKISNDIKTKIKKLLHTEFDLKLKEELSEIKKSLKQSKSKESKDTAEDDNKKDKLDLFGKDILDILLIDAGLNDEDKKVIGEFKGFTTYFTDFSKNMENVYDEKKDYVSIYYRIVDDNLIQFLKNYKKYNDISEKLSNEEKNKEKFDNKIKELKAKKIEKLNNDYADYNVFNDINSFKYTLSQKDIDIYNYIIGGDFDHESKDNKQKEKGINEWINSYNQQQKDKKLPFFTKLRKRILSEVENNQYNLIYSNFNSQEDVLKSFNEIYPKLKKKLDNVKNILNNINDYDLGKIYINTEKINSISNDYFDVWSVIRNAIGSKEIKKYKESFDGELNKFFKKRPQFSIKEINDYLLENKNIADYYTSYDKFENLFKDVEEKYKEIKPLLENIPQNDLSKKKVLEFKKLLDSIKQINYKIKYLYVKDIIDKDNSFYSSIDDILENDFKEFDKFYNKARNFFTKKPYSTDKFKINFNNQELLNGWDLNQEAKYLNILLKKNENYYLGIIPKIKKDKEKQKILDELNKNENSSSSFYEKMCYKCLGQSNRQLPRICFSKTNKDLFKLDKKDFVNKDKKVENLRLINFYKECLFIYPAWKENFEFKFKDTKEYKSIGDFYSDVEKQSYKIWFNKVDENYIHNLVKDKKLFLFQIYNKDFSEHSKGKLNLHTLYFKALFNEDNLKNPKFKLNGQAEIFFREKSIEYKITHPKEELIPNKLFNKNKKDSKFTYDIVKDRRFTDDKFLFHVPITINYQADNRTNINNKVVEYIKKNEVNIIGIDRGERNLLYITLLDSKGKLILQESLNKIKEIPYYDLIDAKEKGRTKAKQEWDTIENIKNIKEGYMSNIVHFLAKLIIEKKAILVLENLNLCFKNTRLKFEKQIYSKFEKMLINKLNYLVFKDKNNFNELGGVLQGYQLTNAYEEKRTYNQNGFIFYIPPSYTSKIDPVTGFVNFFNIQYKNIEASKNFISKFDKIGFKDELFYFEFDYQKFDSKDVPKYSKKSKDIKKSQWTIFSNSTRIKFNKKNNQSEYKELTLNDEFKNLFDKYKINYKDNNDLKDLILNTANLDKDFWEQLLKLIKLTLQLRNSFTKDKDYIDYIISPVKDKDGKFYDSRDYKKGDKLPLLPCDADANGAYNIARKGLMLVEKIKNNVDPKKLDLNIKDVDWFNYAQQVKKSRDLSCDTDINDTCNVL